MFAQDTSVVYTRNASFTNQQCGDIPTCMQIQLHDLQGPHIAGPTLPTWQQAEGHISRDDLPVTD